VTYFVVLIAQASENGLRYHKPIELPFPYTFGLALVIPGRDQHDPPMAFGGYDSLGGHDRVSAKVGGNCIEIQARHFFNLDKLLAAGFTQMP
jgi:hypothetical protein